MKFQEADGVKIAAFRVEAFNGCPPPQAFAEVMNSCIPDNHEAACTSSKLHSMPQIPDLASTRNCLTALRSCNKSAALVCFTHQLAMAGPLQARSATQGPLYN